MLNDEPRPAWLRTIGGNPDASASWLRFRRCPPSTEQQRDREQCKRGLPGGQEIQFTIQFQDLSPKARLSEPLRGRFRTVPQGRADFRFVWSGDTAGQGWGINRDARYKEKKVPLLTGRATKAFLEYAPARFSADESERVYRKISYGLLLDRPPPVPWAEHGKPAGGRNQRNAIPGGRRARVVQTGVQGINRHLEGDCLRHADRGQRGGRDGRRRPGTVYLRGGTRSTRSSMSSIPVRRGSAALKLE